ncbi:MAG: hypothetical protein IT436_07285 [Phycisphaerales bacterium]|nr:hypothetical protein [Phycisphaerales bacterium]
MRLFLWPSSAQELQAGGVTGVPGPIRPAAERATETFGWWTGARLLDEHGPGEVLRCSRQTGVNRVVASAGSLHSLEGGEDAGARSLLRTHAGEGMTALLAAVEETVAGLSEGESQLCLRPEAADVLSDLPSCLVYLRSPAAAQTRLVVDPMALLTPAMVEYADDHLERMLGAMGAHPGVAAVMLTNAGPGPDGEGLRPVGLHRQNEAVFDARRLIALAARHAGPGVDWIILDEGVAEQVELLRMYGPGV